MAGLPVISNTWRVSFSWHNDNTPHTAANVMHFRKGGGSSAALWTSLDSHVTTAMFTMQPNYAHVTEVDITPLDGTGLTVPNATGSPTKWSGNGGSGDFIPAMANIIKMLTAKRGRSYRGRIFLPWVLEGMQSNGTLSGNNVTTTSGAWATFLTAMIGDGYAPVVASYLHATAEDITALTCESAGATVRRRQRR